MTDTPKADGAVVRSHDYHAEAHVLSGELQRPVEQKIEQHAPVTLKGPRGGHLTRLAEEVSIEGAHFFCRRARPACRAVRNHEKGMDGDFVHFDPGGP